MARGSSAARMAREIIETLVLTLVIFFSVRAVVQSFRVEGLSMAPNLRPQELLLVNKAVFWRIDEDSPVAFLARGAETGQGERFLFHPPRRGDIIVFEAPESPGIDYIKRVIGLPGDHIELRDGRVYRNGARLKEPYLRNVRTNASALRPDRWTVPEGALFVLGDNRSNSSDSRDWDFVPMERVVGEAEWAYWPVSEWGGVHNAVLLRLGAR